MVITVTCHPTRYGSARHYTVKMVTPTCRRVYEVVARTGREAIAAFRAAHQADPQPKEVA